jgi:tRNA G46 methylase TrmB
MLRTDTMNLRNLRKMTERIYRSLHPDFQSLFLDYKVDMEPRYGHGKPPHAELYAIINANRQHYKDWIERALALRSSIWTIKQHKDETNPSRPVWNNGFLPGLDIVGIYTLLAWYKPRKYVEIGSGNSTKVAHKAKREHQLHTEIISIDPMPRAEIDSLADRVVRQRFETVDLVMLDELQANDVLFVDNSHRILPNSDAMVLFLEILPRLRKGVIVHLHDVYLPYDYPQFMCDRAYTEQYGLAIYLLANPKKYETILPNYFISEDEELSRLLIPLWEHDNLQGVERHGGSFWIRIGE